MFSGATGAIPGAFLGGLGIGELILILVIVLIIFGAGKLPQIGDALGKGIRNFRRASRTASEGDEEEVRAEAPRQLPEKTESDAAPLPTVEHTEVTPAKRS